MAKTVSIAAVDIGSFSLKSAVFTQVGGGLRLDGFRIAPLAGEAVGEPEHAAAVTAGLRDHPGAALKTASLSYSVPGQSVFLRAVKLPPSQPDQVAQMVKFEAQQNVPFPIHEVVWDYQLMPGNAGGVEAVIVAIKADLLDRINGSVTAAGSLPERVDVAPLALYNAVRFNYPEDEGCTLVLDIGAKSTHMLFIEPGKLFVRGVPTAGNQISQAIASELDETPEGAQELKHTKGFVGLGGAYEDPPDLVAARIGKVIRSVLTRLHADVNRSIGFYKSQQGGAAPARVLLTGGCAALPYIDIFLSEKLRVPVERLNPLRNIVVADTVDREALQMQGHLLGETVGVALRALGNCPVEINLVPVVSAAKKQALTRVPVAAGCLGAVAALFGGLWWSAHATAGKLTTKLEEAETVHSQVSAVAQKIKANQGDLVFNQGLADEIAAVVSQRGQWIGLLDDLNRRATNGVWITALTPLCGSEPTAPFVRPPEKKANGEVEDIGRYADAILIEGLYEAYDKASLQDPNTGVVGAEVIKAFLNSLTESPQLSFTAADKDNPDLVKLESNAVGQKKLALSFKVQAKLKKPITLVP